MDLGAKLEGARRNAESLENQLGKINAEATRIRTLLVKWQGVVEYLTSLIAEVEKAGGNGQPPAQGADPPGLRVVGKEGTEEGA